MSGHTSAASPADDGGEVARILAMADAYAEGREFATISEYRQRGGDARADIESALSALAAQAARGRRIEAAVEVGRLTVVLERAAIRHPNNLYLSFDEAHDLASAVVAYVRAALAPDGGEEGK